MIKPIEIKKNAVNLIVYYIPHCHVDILKEIAKTRANKNFKNAQYPTQSKKYIKIPPICKQIISLNRYTALPLKY